MPTISIFIRKDDLPKWQALPNKSEFLSNALSSPRFFAADTSLGSTGKPPVALNIPGVTKGSEFVPKLPDPKTGYPCCNAARPCKHWVFNDLDTVWVNQLTGKTREA